MPLAMTGNWQMKNIISNDFNNFFTYNVQIRICIWPNMRYSIIYNSKNIQTFFDFSIVNKMQQLDRKWYFLKPLLHYFTVQTLWQKARTPTSL